MLVLNASDNSRVETFPSLEYFGQDHCRVLRTERKAMGYVPGRQDSRLALPTPVNESSHIWTWRGHPKHRLDSRAQRARTVPSERTLRMSECDDPRCCRSQRTFRE